MYLQHAAAAGMGPRHHPDSAISHATIHRRLQRGGAAALRLCGRCAVQGKARRLERELLNVGCRSAAAHEVFASSFFHQLQQKQCHRSVLFSARLLRDETAAICKWRSPQPAVYECMITPNIEQAETHIFVCLLAGRDPHHAGPDQFLRSPGRNSMVPMSQYR